MTGRHSLLKSILGLALLGNALAPASLPAIASEFKLGIGENVRKQDPPGGATYLPLTTSLANRGVNQDFVTHWFHQGWRNAFPDTGVTYLSGSCNSGSQFNDLAAYQAVLTAGKRLVFVWWWHNDTPCDATLRLEAQNVLRDCLVPMIKALTPGPGLGSQVYIILQPEYNRYDSCGGTPAYADATWSTHINTMLGDIPASTPNGITIKAGPSVGDWAYDESAYKVEGSLAACMPNADFISFHNIFRVNSDHPTPNDTNYGNPSPDQIEHALSYARYLKLRFGKPVLYAYQSTNSTAYGQPAQSEALLDIFRRRASLEAADVNLFGPFWLFPDPSYAGESLIDGANAQRTAFSTWKNESNAVLAGTDRTHSIGFVTPDQGDVLSGAVNVQWISRGRPQTASTFTLDVSINGGAYTNVASNLPGDDNSVMSYSWDACAVAPAPDVRLRLTCAATGATVISGRFAVQKLSATSNAQHTFEAGTQGWVGAGNATVTQGGAGTGFHGGRALSVVSAFSSATQNSYIDNSAPGISIAGTPRFTALVYVPFNLNPCTIPGAEVSKVKIDMQTGSYMSSPQIILQQGWNRVVYDFTGASGTVSYLKMNFNNKWGYTGNPAIYVDEIRIGNDLVYTGGACSSPTPTPLAGSPTPSPSITMTRTPASGTPTNTPSITPSPSPSPTTAAVCAAEYNFDAGSAQGMTAGSVAVSSFSASTAMPYQGTHSLQLNLALTATNNQALMGASGAGFPKDYSGQTLTYWLYLPAGMSNAANPSGATLYVKTGAAFVWTESAWVNLPATAGWVQLSLPMGAVANANDVKELGVKIALGGSSPPWSGTVYVDSLGAAPVCPSATPTPAAASPTRTVTRTITPSITASFSRTASPAVSPSNTPSVTPSITASFSRTASPVISPTITPTISPSITLSGTRSATPSASPSLTPSITRSATPVQSPTLTASITPSPFGSPTFTGTVTLTGTRTSTPSISPSPSATGSRTVTPLGSPTQTPLNTPSQTPADTATMTPAATPTITASPSHTGSITPTSTETSYAGSPTDTFTISPTYTLSDTFTQTVTPSITPTDVDTFTQTSTVTPSHTASGTPVYSPSLTPSATPSFSPSPVASATFTSTATPTITATFTAGPATSTPSTAPGSVDRTAPSLNPQSGPQALVSVRCTGQVEGMELKIYSSGYVLVAQSRLDGPWNAGWHSLRFNITPLPNGTYFYLVRGITAGAPVGLPRRGKLTVLQ
jgi:hypothetical protein